ncbi:hypothetical protein ACVILE_000437 [Streptomyces sp. M18.1]
MYELAQEDVDARGFTAAVLDPASLTAALHEAADTLGSVEVLQFGRVPRGDFMKPVLDTTVTDLDDPLAFSVKGPLTCVNAVLPGMRKLGRGSLLFVNGGSAVRPKASVAGTSIAFAGESAYAQMLHTALAPENVHVAQLIVPGAIRLRLRDLQPREAGRPALRPAHRPQGFPPLRRAHARAAGRHAMSTFVSLRRPLTATAAVGVLLLAAIACSDDSSAGQTPAATGTAASSSGPASTPASASASSTGSDRSTPMDIRVTIDGQEAQATLNGSPAARDLASLLPLTLELEDFHGTERIADPPRKLTTENAPGPQAPKTGDLTYYAPWGNLAIFYKDGASASSDLLILGHIDADADQLSGADRITIEATS